MTVRANKPAFNVREKLKELERPIGVKGNELLRAETAQDARDLVSAGRKNLLINGSFQIWQRSTDYDNSGGGWGYYAADRYKTNRSRTRQVTATVDGREVKALEISPGASGYDGGRGILQKVEDYKIYNKVTTLSAYIKSNVPATANFGFIYNTGAGAGVPNSGKTINTTTEFQKFEITNPSFDPSTSPDTYIITDMTAGVTYTIANAQLEYGRNATEFEHRSYGEELALCQRYFFVYDDGRFMTTSNGNGIIAGNIFYPVTMRSNPTITYYGGNSTTGTVRFYSAGSGAQTNYDTTANTLGTAYNSKNILGFNSSNSISIPNGYSAWVDLGTGTTKLKITGNAEL